MKDEEFKQLTDRLDNLESKHNELCEVLSELNLKRTVDFEEYKSDGDQTFDNDDLDDSEEDEDGTGF